MEKAIVCDIDNTLAIREERDIYDFKEAEIDKPNMPVIKIVELFYKSGYEIILISGREDKYRGVTKKWLEDNGIPYHKLYLRNQGDLRKDETIKKEIFEKHIKDKAEVLFVIDDRDRVLDMCRKDLSLTCLQVDYGNY